MRTSLVSSLLFIAVASGCAGTATGSASYSAQVTPPPLVYINAEVRVIEDHPQPVFYSENMYWRYDGGVWYRSQYHTRGWVRVTVVPASIRRIERPATYVRYRGNAQPAVVRDQRQEIKQEKQADKRELQQEKRELQQEKQADKRELQQEKQAEKQANKRDRKDDKQDKQDKQNKGKDQGKNHKH